jgi:hypothetical protein
MTFFVNVPEEEEEIDEEDASLDDDLLAELDPLEDEDEEDPLTEGFGEIPEEEEKAIEKAAEEDTEEDTEESLEEDAEDVDFDTFDDVDEF